VLHIVEPPMSAAERAALDKSAAILRAQRHLRRSAQPRGMTDCALVRFALRGADSTLGAPR
jgi:hypothetical protein